MKAGKREEGGAPRLDSLGPFVDFGGTRRSVSPFAKASEDTRSHSSTASQPWLPAEAGEQLRGKPGLVRLVAGCLLLSLTSCGAPVSEKAPGPVPSVSKGEAVGGAAAGGAAQRTSDQTDRKAVSVGQAASDTDERDNRSIPGVPDTVVRDLGSADPRDRYRALDFWNVKGSTVPLDAVFEAMEDEDEEVSDKATAIIEKRWAEEQEKEEG